MKSLHGVFTLCGEEITINICTCSKPIYHLTKLSKIRISEKWDMTNELMNNVWLRGVQRVGTMSDILSSMEDSEGKSSKEVTRGDQASNWAKTEARAF